MIGAAAAALQVGRRVYLRRPAPGDLVSFLGGGRRSRALHRGLVQTPGNAADFARYLARDASPACKLHVVCRRDDDAVVGAFNVNEIVRGILQSANLGYFAFAPFAGQGYMREGLELVLRQVFQRYKLHRLEANIQPHNRASIALVRRAGFRREGYSRRLVKIAGRWRDHVRFAILVEDWRAARSARSRGAATAAGRSRTRGGRSPAPRPPRSRR